MNELDPCARASPETRVPIESEHDIVIARQQGRQLAAPLGFSSHELTHLTTVISELGRNILTFAGRGEIIISPIHARNKPGIQVIALDQGPGIADLELALREGYSTSGSLGLGLPGARRLMDEFKIVTAPGEGTTITTKKWIK